MHSPKWQVPKITSEDILLILFSSLPANLPTSKWATDFMFSHSSPSEMRATCSLTRCTIETFAEDAKLLKMLKNCGTRILGILSLANDHICVAVLLPGNGLPCNRIKLTNPMEHLGWTWSLQQQLMSCKVLGSAPFLETVLISSPQAWGTEFCTPGTI